MERYRVGYTVSAISMLAGLVVSFFGIMMMECYLLRGAGVAFIGFGLQIFGHYLSWMYSERERRGNCDLW